jgi:hypothetical protein
MLTLFLTLAVLIASPIAITYFSATTNPQAVLAIAGATAVVWIGLAFCTRRPLLQSGASASEVASATSRNMGLVWLWGALSLLLVYLLALEWREWWHFTLAFALAAALCFGYSATLARDVAAGRDDETMLAIGRYLGIGQLVGMIVTVIGLAIDPDKEFLYIKEGDWAGNSICLAGAVALAVISAYALVTDKKVKSTPGPSN